MKEEKDNILISPSLLSADLLCLAPQIKALEEGGAHWLHVDVMDGHYVPSITFGPPLVKALKKNFSLLLDVHLMITPVSSQVEAFVDAGADILTFHPEADPHPHRVLQLIKTAGIKAGIALNPGTSLSFVEDLLPFVDVVLVMTVNPGWGGQLFIPEMIMKIQKLHRIKQEKNYSFLIQVDGGITPQTSLAVIKAGAQVLVAGTSIFKDCEPKNYSQRILALKGGQDGIA